MRAAWLVLVCLACFVVGWTSATLWRSVRLGRQRRQTRCVRCGAPAGLCLCGALRDGYTRRAWWRRGYGPPPGTGGK